MTETLFELSQTFGEPLVIVLSLAVCSGAVLVFAVVFQMVISVCLRPIKF